MNKAQRDKVAIFYRMGYRQVASPYFTASAESDTLWVSRDMPKGKTIYQEINPSGETVRTFSRPTKEK